METYNVEVWYRWGKYGDEKDFKTVSVQATNKEDALYRAKKQVGITSFSAEIIN